MGSYNPLVFVLGLVTAAGVSGVAYLPGFRKRLRGAGVRTGGRDGPLRPAGCTTGSTCPRRPGCRAGFLASEVPLGASAPILRIPPEPPFGKGPPTPLRRGPSFGA